MTLMLYFVLPVVSLHLQSCTYAVSCLVIRAIIDCQSNALTPSICSMATSIIDVMSLVAASIKCYLFCGHLYGSVVCIYTHSTRSLSGLLFTLT